VFRIGTHRRYPSKALLVGPQGRKCTVHSAHHLAPIMAKQPKKLDELFHDTLKDIIFCRKEDPCDAAEDGESRAGARSEKDLRQAPRRDGGLVRPQVPLTL
jgi:hypothetical protein